MLPLKEKPTGLRSAVGEPMPDGKGRDKSNGFNIGFLAD
jgi:hypothetical protein